MNRWEEAQFSEKAYWEGSFSKSEEEFQKMCLNFYPVYKEILNKNNIVTTDKVILDCGGGAYGFVAVIDGKKKYLLDPLMNYFATKVPDNFYTDRNITPLAGIGEELPFVESFFDLVCCINTLDHAKEPKKIISEANRCLKKEGYLLLSFNHYAWPIVIYRNLLEKLKAGDNCHPYTYHINMVNDMLAENGFKIIDQKIGDTKEMIKMVKEAGGQTKVSLIQRFKRALKLMGTWHVFKQSLAYPGHFVFNKLFKSYPDTIFLCVKGGNNAL